MCLYILIYLYFIWPCTGSLREAVVHYLVFVSHHLSSFTCPTEQSTTAGNNCCKKLSTRFLVSQSWGGVSSAQSANPSRCAQWCSLFPRKENPVLRLHLSYAIPHFWDRCWCPLLIVCLGTWRTDNPFSTSYTTHVISHVVVNSYTAISHIEKL